MTRRAWTGALAVAAALGLLMAALQAVGPAVHEALRYERAAVLQGQLWRLFSAHLLHLGWTHLLLNAAGLLLCAALAPRGFMPGQSAGVADAAGVAGVAGMAGTAGRANLWRLAGRLAWLGLAVSLGLLWGSPQVAHYVGLSGVLYGLFLWSLAPQARQGDPAALLTVAGLLLWAAWQGLAGPLPSEEAAIGGHIVVAAHGYGLAGAALGLLASRGFSGALSWRARQRKTKTKTEAAASPDWSGPGRRRGGTAAMVVGLHLLVLGLLHLGRLADPLTVAPQAVAVRVLEAPAPPPAVAQPAPVAPTLAMPVAVQIPVPPVEVKLDAAPDAPPSSTAPSPQRATGTPGTPGPVATGSPAAPERRGEAPPSDQPITPPQAEAAHLNNPAPPYPPVSRRMGEQGQVWLDVFVQRDGRVGEVKLHRSSGHPLLDQSALSTVRQWRYVPAQRGGQALAVWYLQQVSFVLNP